MRRRTITPATPTADVLSMQPDYSRQQLLKEVGTAGQARLAQARVLVVGAGGLASPVLQYLAGAGVGTLGIVDDDTLAASNLHRQPLYSRAAVGQPKVELARRSLAALNPAVQVETWHERFSTANALALVARFDLVIDCSDNFRTKFLVNDAAVLARKCAIFASVYQYEGQLQVYRPDARHACLRCIWPDAQQDGVVGNCAEAGVLGPVPGILGGLQALLALKLLLGLDGQLAGELLLLDLSNLSTLKIQAPRCAGCVAPGCVRIHSIMHEEMPMEVSFRTLAAARAAGYEVIDIRNDDEVAARPSGARHIPMPLLLADPTPVTSGGPYLLMCAGGKRSLATAQALAAKGIHVKSLIGGVGALAGDG
jgi:adenylyltransferase/sulfurtransferase